MAERPGNGSDQVGPDGQDAAPAWDPASAWDPLPARDPEPSTGVTTPGDQGPRGGRPVGGAAGSIPATLIGEVPAWADPMAESRWSAGPPTVQGQVGLPPTGYAPPTGYPPPASPMPSGYVPPGGRRSTGMPPATVYHPQTVYHPGSSSGQGATPPTQFVGSRAGASPPTLMSPYTPPVMVGRPGPSSRLPPVRPAAAASPAGGAAVGVVGAGVVAGGGDAPSPVVRVAAASADFVRTHTDRAMSRNLRTVLPTKGEWTVLDVRQVREMTVRQFLVWRRSWLFFLIPPAVLASFFHLTWLLFDDSTNFSSHLNTFGTVVLTTTQFVQYLGFPLAALLAVWWWDHHWRSRWVLVAGWACSFLLPFAVALVPARYFVALDPATDPRLLAGEHFTIGVVGGLVHAVMLLPVVLSIIPGVLRACVRIKSVLPESIVPGWFLVLASPTYALVLLLAFIVVNQMAGNLLLIFGVLLLMAAPVAYLWKTPLFIRPIAGQLERRQLAGIQGVYAGVVGLGLLSLLAYVLTVKVAGRPLVGDIAESAGAERAFVGTGTMLWEAVKFVIGYTARSMYITAVAVDLFMLVNLSVWRNTKAFQQTPDAFAYDQIMADFEATAEGRARA